MGSAPGQRQGQRMLTPFRQLIPGPHPSALTGTWMAAPFPPVNAAPCGSQDAVLRAQMFLDGGSLIAVSVYWPLVGLHLN